MTREVLDPTPALGPEAVALLAVARLLPEQSVLGLRAAAAQAGHVRRLFLHVVDCLPCQREALVGAARLCPRAERWREPARGWRERGA